MSLLFFESTQFPAELRKLPPHSFHKYPSVAGGTHTVDTITCLQANLPHRSHAESRACSQDQPRHCACSHRLPRMLRSSVPVKVLSAWLYKYTAGGGLVREDEGGLRSRGGLSLVRQDHIGNLIRIPGSWRDQIRH